VPVKNALARVQQICLALPEAVHETHGDHASFLVRKKTFMYYLNNHHGDGIVAVACKVLPGDNAVLVKAQPEKFYMPAYIASRGWVGLRLDLKHVDWEEVADLISGSYQLVAPKKLAPIVKARKQ
jgi:predicted DNA-binding protein (MmcQ/YjbR family)